MVLKIKKNDGGKMLWLFIIMDGIVWSKLKSWRFYVSYTEGQSQVDEGDEVKVEATLKVWSVCVLRVRSVWKHGTRNV